MKTLPVTFLSIFTRREREREREREKKVGGAVRDATVLEGGVTET
jgi:hypothetical protein